MDSEKESRQSKLYYGICGPLLSLKCNELSCISGNYITTCTFLEAAVALFCISFQYSSSHIMHRVLSYFIPGQARAKPLWLSPSTSCDMIWIMIMSIVEMIINSARSKKCLCRKS